MYEFNSDGSIKLPGRIQKKAEDDGNKLKFQKCIKIKKEVVKFDAPKKCVLHLTLSDTITDDRFVDTIYKRFKSTASTPSKITKLDDKNFEIEIGSDFRRCTDCTSLVNQYREFMDSNLILEKGNCTFEGGKKNFTYEDHFD